MAASFPSSVKTFSTLVDLIDSVLASHQNDRALEVTAIENYLIETATELTISSDAITATKSRHKLQPQTGTTDNLATISGMPDGGTLYLYCSDAGTDTITVKHGTGNISCIGAKDIELSTGFVIFYRSGSTIYAVGGGGSAPTPPLGRLTLTSATPVLTADVANATSIYYTPYLGGVVPIYNGSWSMTSFTQLTLALDSTITDTGYHQSGKIFDLFVYSDSGTLRLVSGPAWTNDTTRATALEYVNGILMNAASMTARYGSATGNTVTVAQDRGTYVGTFYASANGQTTWEIGGDAANGDPIKIYLWNAYNRVEFDFSCHDTTDSWNYSTATWRSKNNSTTNRASFVRGLQEDGIFATNSAMTGKTASDATRSGIAIDATNTFTVNAQTNSTNTIQVMSIYSQNPGLGFHYLQAVEYDAGGGTTTWYGDNAGNNRLGLTFKGRF